MVKYNTKRFEKKSIYRFNKKFNKKIKNRSKQNIKPFFQHFAVSLIKHTSLCMPKNGLKLKKYLSASKPISIKYKRFMKDLFYLLKKRSKIRSRNYKVRMNFMFSAQSKKYIFTFSLLKNIYLLNSFLTLEVFKINYQSLNLKLRFFNLACNTLNFLPWVRGKNENLIFKAPKKYYNIYIPDLRSFETISEGLFENRAIVNFRLQAALLLNPSYNNFLNKFPLENLVVKAWHDIHLKRSNSFNQLPIELFFARKRMAGKLAPRTLRMQTKFVKQRASRKVKILRTFQVMRTFIFKKKYKRYGFKLRKKFFRKNNKKNVKIFNKRFRRNNLLRVKQWKRRFINRFNSNKRPKSIRIRKLRHKTKFRKDTFRIQPLYGKRVINNLAKNKLLTKRNHKIKSRKKYRIILRLLYKNNKYIKSSKQYKWRLYNFIIQKNLTTLKKLNSLRQTYKQKRLLLRIKKLRFITSGKRKRNKRFKRKYIKFFTKGRRFIALRTVNKNKKRLRYKQFKTFKLIKQHKVPAYRHYKYNTFIKKIKKQVKFYNFSKTARFKRPRYYNGFWNKYKKHWKKQPYSKNVKPLFNFFYRNKWRKKKNNRTKAEFSILKKKRKWIKVKFNPLKYKINKRRLLRSVYYYRALIKKVWWRKWEELSTAPVKVYGLSQSNPSLRVTNQNLRYRRNFQLDRYEKVRHKKQLKLVIHNFRAINYAKLYIVLYDLISDYFDKVVFNEKKLLFVKQLILTILKKIALKPLGKLSVILRKRFFYKKRSFMSFKLLGKHSKLKLSSYLKYSKYKMNWKFYRSIKNSRKQSRINKFIKSLLKKTKKGNKKKSIRLTKKKLQLLKPKKRLIIKYIKTRSKKPNFVRKRKGKGTFYQKRSFTTKNFYKNKMRHKINSNKKYLKILKKRFDKSHKPINMLRLYDLHNVISLIKVIKKRAFHIWKKWSAIYGFNLKFTAPIYNTNSFLRRYKVTKEVINYYIYKIRASRKSKLDLKKLKKKHLYKCLKIFLKLKARRGKKLRYRYKRFRKFLSRRIKFEQKKLKVRLKFFNKELTRKKIKLSKKQYNTTNLRKYKTNAKLWELKLKIQNIKTKWNLPDQQVDYNSETYKKINVWKQTWLKNFKTTAKNHHVRLLTNEFLRSKSNKQVLDRSNVRDISRLKLYWKLLTQNNKYHQENNLTPLATRKFDTLRNIVLHSDKMRFINVRVHKIDLAKNNEIRFFFTPKEAAPFLTMKYRNERFGRPFYKQFNEYKVARLSIFYDKNFIKYGNLYKPWLTLVKDPVTNTRNVLLFVDPYNRVLYFINLLKIGRLSVFLENLLDTNLFNIKSTLTNLREGRYYLVKEDVNIYNTHFFEFYDSRFNDFNLERSPENEYIFKYNLPVASSKAFTPSKKSSKFLILINFLRQEKKYQKLIKLRNLKLTKNLIFTGKSLILKKKLQKQTILLRNIWLNRLNFLNVPHTDKVGLHWLGIIHQFNAIKYKLAIAHIKNYFMNIIKLNQYQQMRSFRWKLFNRRWPFAYSKWKRATIFKYTLEKAWDNYRKLKYHFLFIKLFRTQLLNIFGINQYDLWNLWVKIRKGNNHLAFMPVADRFITALQLKLDGLAMTLGFAPNRLFAQELVKSGGLRINGIVITNCNFLLSVNDIIQIDLTLKEDISQLFRISKLNPTKSRILFLPYFQVSWSMLLFTLIRWPLRYEILEESILTSRWMRFYIRHLPVKRTKYINPKVKWIKY